MKISKLLFLFYICLMGCQPYSDCKEIIEREKEYRSRQQAQVSGLHYFRDAKTNLCFVGRNLGQPWGVLTHVPCTPEVEDLIKEQNHYPSCNDKDQR